MQMTTNSFDSTLKRGLGAEAQPFPSRSSYTVPYSGGDDDLSNVSLESTQLRKANDSLVRQLKHVERIQRKRELQNAQELDIEREKHAETTQLLQDNKIRQWELQTQNVCTSPKFYYFASAHFLV